MFVYEEKSHDWLLTYFHPPVTKILLFLLFSNLSTERVFGGLILPNGAEHLAVGQDANTLVRLRFFLISSFPV